MFSIPKGELFPFLPSRNLPENPLDLFLFKQRRAQSSSKPVQGSL